MDFEKKDKDEASAGHYPTNALQQDEEVWTLIPFIMWHKLRNQFFFALIIVLIMCVGITFSSIYGMWGIAAIGVVIELFCIRWLYRICKQPVRKVAFLLDAIDNDDAAIHFYEHTSQDDISQVNGMLNKIARILYNT